jgi:hypothetical protein
VLLVSAAAAAPLRAPAVPLAVSTPFFSIWSMGSELAAPTALWHGDRATLASAVRVDNVTYTLMGAPSAGARPAAQLGLANVTALSSRYAFSAGGVSVWLRFTTPALPGDAVASSRGGTYLEWSAAAADGAAHAVQLFFGASGEAVTGGFAGEELEWDRPALPGGALALRVGLTGQRAPGFNLTARLRASTEPHQSQDFGFVYVIANATLAGARLTSAIGPQSAALAAFAATGALSGQDAPPPAPAAAVDPTLAALAFDLGELGR